MCGRFAQGDIDAIYSKYRVRVPLKLRRQIRARYNIAPAQPVPVINRDRDNENNLEIMRWGLIPSWAKDPSIGYKMINARSETVNEKPSFRYSLKSRRCIVPATGFYEWEKTNGHKIPHYIHLNDKRVFSLAGLYDMWTDAEGKTFTTFTILTTGPNKIVKPIHNRMPVILEEEEEEPWLDKDFKDTEALANMLDPYPDTQMHEYTVSTAVNLTKTEGKGLIDPIKKPI